MQDNARQSGFYVGQTDSLIKTFSEQEIIAFSALSMDANPIHLDEQYAATTRFGRRIVQGPMVASLIGGVLGSKLPGPGSIYISQQSRFVNPLFIGETVEAKATITSIRVDKPIIKLITTVKKLTGELIIEGEATILFI